MAVFNVELKKVVDDSYEIEIGYRLMDQLVADIRNGLCGKKRKFALITDSNVGPLYGEPIAEKLISEGYLCKVYEFPAGEKSKTRETKAMLEDRMLADGFRRDCCVIAVGGGVVTDIAGFLAGTFARGIPFINYATSLLAAADASVGGKTAVDTPLATNLIGLFNQPIKVYIDIAAWSTLPKRQMSSGMAETIKHACLADAEMFAYLEKHLDRILANDPECCEYIAKKNCSIKYHVVMQDEKEESGLREILNLGHTVGRAVETVSDYSLLHGEALGIGMAAEVRLSQKFGYMTEEEADRVIALYRRAGLPVEIPEGIDREELVRKLYTDKKVRDGKLRFVLQQGIGRIVEFAPGVYAKEIDEDTARSVIRML